MKGLLIHIADIFPLECTDIVIFKARLFILWRNTEFSAIGYLVRDVRSGAVKLCG